MSNRPVIKPSSVNAYGYNSQSKIPLLGEFLTTVKSRHKSLKITYLVLDGEATDILGYSAATALGIVNIDCDVDPNICHIQTKL